MAVSPSLQLNRLWRLWCGGSALQRPLLISVAAKGKPNMWGKCFSPATQHTHTQKHTLSMCITSPPSNAFTYWQDRCTVATHRQCSASVVTKCRKFMPDSAVVVRKYILILWSPLLHWWSKKAPGSEVKGASDLKLISRSSQCDSALSSWCVLQVFFYFTF